jgi:hypothetical protein
VETKSEQPDDGEAKPDDTQKQEEETAKPVEAVLVEQAAPRKENEFQQLLRE